MDTHRPPCPQCDEGTLTCAGECPNCTYSGLRAAASEPVRVLQIQDLINQMLYTMEKSNLKQGDYLPATVTYAFLEAVINQALHAYLSTSEFRIKAVLGKDGLRLMGSRKPLIYPIGSERMPEG